MRAREILELNERWSCTDSSSIAEKVTGVLASMGYDTFTKRINALSEMTKSKPDAVYAWFNRSRGNVKIPFLKLCMISDATGKEIENFLEEKSMQTSKFAVMNVIKNDETILKLFDESQKKEAIAYGEELLKTDFDGVIVCAKIKVDENGSKVGNSTAVYKVWNEEDKVAKA